MLTFIILFSFAILVTTVITYHYLVNSWAEVSGIMAERSRRKKDRAYLKVLRGR